MPRSDSPLTARGRADRRSAPPPPDSRTIARRGPHDQDAILDASERVILRDGIGCFTLESVADEAGLSKSGLLHHFPGKDALIDAMVRRAVLAWRHELLAAFEAQPPGRGRFARASIANCLGSSSKWTADLRRRGSVLVAALVHHPDRVQPLRDVCREVQTRVRDDGLAAGTGEVVRLVLDGLWFGWIFGFAVPHPGHLSTIRSVLQNIVDRAASGSHPPHPRRPRRPRRPRSPRRSTARRAPKRPRLTPTARTRP